MPLDQNGNYTRLSGPTSWQDDRDEGLPILASRHDADGEDMAQAISQMLPKDGRAAMSGPLKMGGNRVQNIGDASNAQDAATAKQVQSGAFCYGEDISLTQNEIQVNLTPSVGVMPNYIFMAVKVKNANTGAVTLKLNNLEAAPVLYGEEELYEGTLEAGKVYFFAYNRALGAFQLMLSGAPAVSTAPLFSFIMTEGLIPEDKSGKGWRMQGSRCYRRQYWDAYDTLLKEYEASIDTQETITKTELDSQGNATQTQKVFTFKKNPDTCRRFYEKAQYDARFEFTGDSGGFVLEEETTSFYLPKSKNFFRAETDADNAGKFFDDTMRPITGRCGQIGGEDKGDLGNGEHSEGALEVEYGGAKNQGHDNNGQGVKAIKLNSAKLGANFDGTETAPKHKTVFLYYRVANYFGPEISAAASSAEASAASAQASAEEASGAAQAAGKAADRAEQAASGIDLQPVYERIEALEQEIASLKANTKIVAGDNVTIEEISQGTEDK